MPILSEAASVPCDIFLKIRKVCASYGVPVTEINLFDFRQRIEIVTPDGLISLPLRKSFGNYQFGYADPAIIYDALEDKLKCQS